MAGQEQDTGWRRGSGLSVTRQSACVRRVRGAAPAGKVTLVKVGEAKKRASAIRWSYLSQELDWGVCMFWGTREAKSSLGMYIMGAK